MLLTLESLVSVNTYCFLLIHALNSNINEPTACASPTRTVGTEKGIKEYHKCCDAVGQLDQVQQVFLLWTSITLQGKSGYMLQTGAVTEAHCCCRMIQKGVRRFLKMLYLRRRRDSASLIIRCLRSMQHDSSIKNAFKKLIKSVQTLKVRSICLSCSQKSRSSGLCLSRCNLLQTHRVQANHVGISSLLCVGICSQIWSYDAVLDL